MDRIVLLVDPVLAEFSDGRNVDLLLPSRGIRKVHDSGHRQLGEEWQREVGQDLNAEAAEVRGESRVLSFPRSHFPLRPSATSASKNYASPVISVPSVLRPAIHLAGV